MDTKKQMANNLRKNQKYEQAEAIYKELYESSDTKDGYDAAGYLHCLRKQRKFAEAISIADAIPPELQDIAWCRNEMIWSYIQGILMDVSADFNSKDTAFEKIKALKPDITALKVSLLKLFKEAKKSKRFDFIKENIDLINPADLDNKPNSTNTKSDWSDRAMWYYYNAESLINSNDDNKAIELIETIIDKFPRQKKFFLRLKAKAFYNLKNTEQALKIYEALCNTPHPDWWILNEYGQIIAETGCPEKALPMLLLSSSLMPKLDMKVVLMQNLGRVYKDLEQYEMSFFHFMLSKLVREEKGWNMPESLSASLQELSSFFQTPKKEFTIDELLKACKKEWLKGKPSAGNEKKDLKGKVISISPEKPFCFIKSGSESYFCFTKDLPEGISREQKVIFDITPSFDKKKQRESYRAINIRKE